MFYRINNQKEFVRILGEFSGVSLSEILHSSPTLGIMVLDCFINQREGNSISLASPPILRGIKFYCWRDIGEHIDWAINNEKLSLKVTNDVGRREKILNFSKNAQRLFCFALALFIESQMKFLSLEKKTLEDEVKKNTLSVLEGDNLSLEYDNQFSASNSNAQIFITLHADDKLFVKVTFPEQSIREWQEELETGTALIVPQLLDYSLKNLDTPDDILLRTIVKNEFLVWEKEKPEIGKSYPWKWLQDVIDEKKENDNNNEYAHFIKEEWKSKNSKSAEKIYKTKTQGDEEDEALPDYKKFFLKGALFGLGVTFIAPRTIADTIPYALSNIFIFGAIGYSILVFKTKEYKKLWTSLIILLLGFFIPGLLF